LGRKNGNLPVCKNTKNRYKWKPEFDEQFVKWVEYQFINNKNIPVHNGQEFLLRGSFISWLILNSSFSFAGFSLF